MSTSRFPFSCLNTETQSFLLREAVWAWKIRHFNFEAARRLKWFMLCCSRSLETLKIELFAFCLLRKTIERRPAGCIPTWSHCILTPVGSEIFSLSAFTTSFCGSTSSRRKIGTARSLCGPISFLGPTLRRYYLVYWSTPIKSTVL